MDGRSTVRRGGHRGQVPGDCTGPLAHAGRPRRWPRPYPASARKRRRAPPSAYRGRRWWAAPWRPERETSLYRGTIGRTGGACYRWRSEVANCRARTGR